MRRVFYSLAIAGMSLAFCISASAQDGQQGMGKGQNMPVFSDCDLNGDGIIVAEEFYQARSQRMAAQAEKGGKMKNAANAPPFEDIDTNGNGEISEEEFNVHKAEMMEKRRQKMQNS